LVSQRDFLERTIYPLWSVISTLHCFMLIYEYSYSTHEIFYKIFFLTIKWSGTVLIKKFTTNTNHLYGVLVSKINLKLYKILCSTFLTYYFCFFFILFYFFSFTFTCSHDSQQCLPCGRKRKNPMTSHGQDWPRTEPSGDGPGC
jgi:hypothetical protein